MYKLLRLILVAAVGCLVAGFYGYCAEESAGTIDKQEQDLRKDAEMNERLTNEKTKVTAPEVIEPFTAKPLEGEQAVLIKKIEVTGAGLFDAAQVETVTAKYVNKELTLKQMQAVCDEITALYRAKGYLTSRAYLAPQTIKEGVLSITIIEGKIGDVVIKGNKYFKDVLIKKDINVKPGKIFDYETLQENVDRLNRYLDRVVKAVLVPGKVPGTTDIVFQVVDKFPVHIGFDYDNYGSRLIGGSRFAAILEHNNLTGNDDRLSYKYQLSQARYYWLHSLAYALPISSNWNLNFYYLKSFSRLGKEYKSADITGKSDLAGVSVSYEIFNKAKTALSAKTGFDYKRVNNFTAGTLTSRDNDRVVNVGLDLDFTDKLGRNIVSAQGDSGIPNVLNGAATKVPLATRLGAGGKFWKATVDYYRLQPMFLSSSLLLKGQYQFSPYKLLSIEQFQLGGVSSVRAYPAAEYSGDKGYFLGAEWSFPFYGLSKTLKVPFSKSTIYDAARWVLFYDTGTTGVKGAPPGEGKRANANG